MTQKNHTFLLNVFAKMHEIDSKTKLLLVGKGDLETSLKAQIRELGLEDEVIFAGVRTDIPQVLSALDVFVFPSFYEGMPNTVIEAQATGLPCVIADTITREADITGLVEYLPLSESAERWAKTALEKVSKERKDTKADFIKNKYDIPSVTEEFVSLVFGENNNPLGD
jgi:glycosyltransferase involved in cell wall biosynthesis